MFGRYYQRDVNRKNAKVCFIDLGERLLGLNRIFKLKSSYLSFRSSNTAEAAALSLKKLRILNTCLSALFSLSTFYHVH